MILFAPAIALAQDQVHAYEQGTQPVLRAPAPAPRSVWQPPPGALYNNGHLTDGDATGCSGDTGNASILQDATLQMTFFGYDASLANGRRLADDFVVPTGATWSVDNVYLFAYQSGSDETSTITAANFRIWNGPPNNPNSLIVCGDGSSNMMTATAFSGAYRTLESAPLCDRPLMVENLDLSACPVLDAGSYWIDWQMDGTLDSGPWSPPLVRAGLRPTGNGLQYSTDGGNWIALIDGGTGGGQQGLPFVLMGSAGVSDIIFSGDFDGP